MSNEQSRAKLLEFLDYLGNKGLMSKSTVAARKAAVSKVLGILHEDEATDVTKLNLGDVMLRFQNLEGKNYTPGSLNTYLSRLRSSVEDFEAYSANPLGFRSSVQSRERRSKSDGNLGNKLSNPTQDQADRDKPSSKSSPPPSASILPIPIRADVTVYVQGLPYDLTEGEAGKIANVIRAMAAPT